jgi:hypothetical protein
MRTRVRNNDPTARGVDRRWKNSTTTVNRRCEQLLAVETGTSEARGGNGHTDNDDGEGEGDDNRTTGTTQHPQLCDDEEDGHHHEQLLVGWKRGAVRPGTTGRGSSHDEDDRHGKR